MADLQQLSKPRPSQSNFYRWEIEAHGWWVPSRDGSPTHPQTTCWRGIFLFLLAGRAGVELLSADKSYWRGIFLLLLAALLGLGGFQGCAGLAGPNWRHPGTAQTQQLRALRFDPYPEDDLGPSVEGARPLEFQNPPPDIQRSRPHELRRRWFPWQTTSP